MPDDNVVRIKNDLYQKAKDLADAEGITIADAVTKLVESGGIQPTSCELEQFKKVLEQRGLTPPKQAGWVWGVTQTLPPEVMAGTKLQPYAEAKTEAELRCTLGDQLFDKMVGDLGSAEAVEEALDGAIAESAPPAAEATEPAEPAEPVGELEADAAEAITEPEPTLPTTTIPPEPEAEVGAGTEAPTSAKVESTEEVESVEPAEVAEEV